MEQATISQYPPNSAKLHGNSTGGVSIRPIIIVKNEKTVKRDFGSFETWFWVILSIITLLSFYLGLIQQIGPYQSLLCALFKYQCKPLHIDLNSFSLPRYNKIEKIFYENLRNGYDSSAQLSIWKDGERVVELAASIDDANFKIDSLINILECSQVLSNLVVASAVDHGWLSYDDKVIQYWQGFPTRTVKRTSYDPLDSINYPTIADVLRHEFGINNYNLPLSIKNLNFSVYEWNKIIEDTYLMFPKETNRVYNPFYRDNIVNEIIKRVHPKQYSIGEIYRNEWYKKYGTYFALSPLNDIEFINLRYLKKMNWPWKTFRKTIPNWYKDEHVFRCLGNCSGTLDRALSMTSTEYPSIGVFTNAKSLGKIGRLISNREEDFMRNEIIDLMVSEDVKKYDAALTMDTVITKGGFLKVRLCEQHPEIIFYGYASHSGTIFYFNLEYKFSIAYVSGGEYVGLYTDDRTDPIVQALCQIIGHGK